MRLNNEEMSVFESKWHFFGAKMKEAKEKQRKAEEMQRFLAVWERINGVGKWGVNLGQDRLLSRYLVLSAPTPLDSAIRNQVQTVEQCIHVRLSGLRRLLSR